MGASILLSIKGWIYLFTKFPQDAWNALSSLGNRINAAFTAAFNWVVRTVTTSTANIVTFFVGLPGRIGSALAALPSRIGAMFTNAFNFVRGIVSTGIANNIAFWSALPGRIVGALGRLAGAIGGVFSSAFNWARGIVSTGITNIINSVVTLPTRIASLGGRMLSAGRTLISNLFSGIQAALRGVGGFASDIAANIKNAINDTLHLPLSINIDKGPLHIHATVIPRFAQGTIADKPTFGIFGEAGREAVIPATRDKAGRAARLLDESGILDFSPVRSLIARRMRAVAPPLPLSSQSDRAGSSTYDHSRTVNLNLTMPSNGRAPDLVTDLPRALARVNLLVGTS